MSKPFKLSIPNPCDARWDHMSLEEKSRHCKLCSQSVYELEEFEESEVVDLLQQQACVRIRSNADGQIKVRTGFSSILLLGGLLACGEKTEEPILEVEDDTPVEVLQVTSGEPVHVEFQEDTDEELPPPLMGKIVPPVHPQPRHIKMSEVETVNKDHRTTVHRAEKKSMDVSKDDCQTEQTSDNQPSLQ